MTAHRGRRGRQSLRRRPPQAAQQQPWYPQTDADREPAEPTVKETLR